MQPSRRLPGPLSPLLDSLPGRPAVEATGQALGPHGQRLAAGEALELRMGTGIEPSRRQEKALFNIGGQDSILWLPRLLHSFPVEALMPHTQSSG